MAASIGPLTLKVTANSDGLTESLGKASKFLEGWAGKTHAYLNKSTQVPGFAKGGFLGKFADAAGSVYENPLKAANNLLVGGAADLISSVPYVGAALALPLKTAQGGISVALDAYAKASSNIISIGKSALKTGMSASDFQVFALMADSTEIAEKALFKFQRTLATVQLTATGHRTVFDGLGIDGKHLAEVYAKDAPKALGIFADKLIDIGHPALIAHAVMETIGRGGMEMIPMLMKGSAGIEEIQGKISTFGMGINGGLVDSVKQVAKASKDIQYLWTGFSNQLVVAVAPIMAEIAARIGPITVGFKGLGNTIVDYVGKAVLWVAKMIDAWDADEFGVKMAEVWADIKAGADEAIDYIGVKLDAMLDKRLEKFNKLLVLFPSAGKAAGVGGTAQFASKQLDDDSKAGGGGGGYFGKDAHLNINTWKDKAQEAIDSIKDRMGGVQKGKDFGAFAPLIERANILKDGLKGPLDLFRNTFLEIKLISDEIAKENAKILRKEALQKDMVGPFLPTMNLDTILKEKQAFRGMGLAFDKLSDTYKLPERKFNGAALDDSTEAFSAILQHQTQPNDTVQERMEKILIDQLEQARLQTLNGQEVAKLLEKRPDLFTGFQ